MDYLKPLKHNQHFEPKTTLNVLNVKRLKSFNVISMDYSKPLKHNHHFESKRLKRF